jgi:hypothetical protein
VAESLVLTGASHATHTAPRYLSARRLRPSPLERTSTLHRRAPLPVFLPNLGRDRTRSPQQSTLWSTNGIGFTRAPSLRNRQPISHVKVLPYSATTRLGCQATRIGLYSIGSPSSCAAQDEAPSDYIAAPVARYPARLVGYARIHPGPENAEQPPLLDQQGTHPPARPRTARADRRGERRHSTTVKQEMKAAVFHGPGQLEVEERPVPEIGPDDVLLEVEARGICGTDQQSAPPRERMVKSFPPPLARLMTTQRCLQ